MISAMSNPLSLPQMIDANGLRFGYHSVGEGPLVLMLHGFPDTAKAWDPIATPIAVAGYRVVAPYLRGYAPTQMPSRDTTIEDLGGDVVGLIDSFGGDPTTVVGHDWGAAAAYAAAAMAPEKVSKLVTVALPHPAGFKPKVTDFWGARHFVTFRRKSAPRKFIANDFRGLRQIYSRWSPEWDVAEAELADIKRCLANPESLNAIFGYYRATERKPSDLMRRKIGVPTVAFAGVTDGVVPAHTFDQAASRFTDGYEVIELPGGHFAHREDPELFTAKLLDVLAR